MKFTRTRESLIGVSNLLVLLVCLVAATPSLSSADVSTPMDRWLGKESGCLSLTEKNTEKTRTAMNGTKLSPSSMNINAYFHVAL